jgi:hypothetical protein
MSDPEDRTYEGDESTNSVPPIPTPPAEEL